MFTLFGLIRWVSLVAGALLVGLAGFHLAGMGGGVGGALAGMALGWWLGVLPYTLSLRALRKDLSGADSVALKQRLVDEYYISGIILDELNRRGEDWASLEGEVFQMMRSDSVSRRCIGFQNLQLLFPERARVMSDYDPYAPAEDCRQQVAKIQDSPMC
ncbi:hypothetical protein [Myxococcus sp. AB036A]|uniref:hypothetical protein n=1 Tax=Myxococcus sp. AB036A TaxID=2562793 RepID=UPI001146B7BE|nr:hypothetical protein [Myxococcus sp. AB036A]